MHPPEDGVSADLTTQHRLLFRSAADLDDLADETVDLIVTSPPYPMIEMWDETFAEQDDEAAAALAAGDGPRAFSRMHELLLRAWRQCHRVLRPGGLACINVGDATRSDARGFRLYPNHSRIIEHCTEIGFETLPAILWRKQTNAPNKFMGSGMLPAGAYVTLEHEYILVFRKGGKREFGAAATARRRESAFFWEERNQWFSDLWDFKGVRQMRSGGGRRPGEGPGEGRSKLRERSGAFPFELAYRLILMYSLREDVVLDPFVGTGTTTAAAVAAARNSIGVELRPELESEIVETVRHAALETNGRVRDRIAAHLRFIAEREKEGKAPPKHRNARHGFPVMTGQETELRLSYLGELRFDGEGRFTATYRDIAEVATREGAQAPSELSEPWPSEPPPPRVSGFPRTQPPE